MQTSQDRYKFAQLDRDANGCHTCARRARKDRRRAERSLMQDMKLPDKLYLVRDKDRLSDAVITNTAEAAFTLSDTMPGGEVFLLHFISHDDILRGFDVDAFNLERSIRNPGYVAMPHPRYG